MKTAHTTYQLRRKLGTTVAIAVTVAAGVAASASPAAPVAPTFAVSTTCTHTSMLISATRPQLVRTTRATGLRTSSYDWPVKPFDRQHPVRGYLNDPRSGNKKGQAFHFGIDIAVPDGTPVYAIRAGTVYFDNPQAIAVVEPG
jgi:murein DD-endopeptidase MepM/ murein hydrolase activator NlpD